MCSGWASIRLNIVLIDTWWNVNTNKKDIIFFNLLLLIDTSWNVYMWNLVSGADYSSFNRYMVECECICSFCRVNFVAVLIDTWWNVNLKILRAVLSLIVF